MTPGRSERVRQLFESVRNSTPEERDKTLDPLRASDPQLFEEVEALLRETRTVPVGPVLNFDPLEAPPPQRLEQRYRLERPIGRGGFGIVYLARDERLHNKPVVVKFLIGETRRDEWFRKKFRDEIEALSRLDHPGIVGILDAGQTSEGTPFLVMQYVEGVTLRSLIIPGGLDLLTTAHIVQQIGQALAAAHSRGVFHRDLKPENIMVRKSPEGEFVRLIDFGIATIREQGFERATAPTRVAGSLSYMAPEQFYGQPGSASDIFAMGVIAWELLAGKLPFRNQSPVQAMVNPNFLEELDELHHLRPDVPAAAIAAIRKALAIEPSARFQTAIAFGDDLAQALRTPSVAPHTPSLQQRLLDVAMARQVPIHKPAEVMALIRRTESGGLAAVLQVEEDHSVAKEDIRSKPFQLEFPVSSSGSLQPLELGLRLDCPDFEPKAVSKILLVPPAGDSDACTFLITPMHLGELRVNVELTRGDVLVASRALKTESTPSDRKIADPARILVSIPLSVLVRASETTSAGEFTRMVQAAAAGSPVLRSPLELQPPHPVPPRARGARNASLAAATVVVIGVGAFLALREPKAPPTLAQVTAPPVQPPAPENPSPAAPPPMQVAKAPPPPAAPQRPSAAPPVQLRTAKTTVSVDQAKAMVARRDFYHARWNEGGKGLQHQYRKQVIQDAVLVVDQAAGLMWQQGGSGKEPPGFQGAEEYVRGLNTKNFAGFSDWRLPTLEEAMSIMTTPQGGTPEESQLGNATVKGVMHLDRVFDKNAAPFIWTSDSASPDRGWVVYYLDGICDPESLQFSAYVRAVRSQ